MNENQNTENKDSSSEEKSFTPDVLGLALMPGFTLIGIIICFVIFIAPFALLYYLFFN